MTGKQRDVMDVLVVELEERVIEIIDRSGNSRFYMGSMEKPTSEDYSVTVVGVEVTDFFSDDAIRLDKNTLKIKLQEYLARAIGYNNTFSSNFEWIINSK